MSLTAAILKWLEFTPEFAVLVVSCDGFIEWASSSKPAFRKGAFFRTRNRPPIAVPEGTLAAQAGGYFNPDPMDHSCGVWFRDFAATEFAVISERYDNDALAAAPPGGRITPMTVVSRLGWSP